MKIDALPALSKAIDPNIAWSIYPDRFANYASNGKWERYRHLQYISTRLMHSIVMGGGRYIVTLPPRHGKSELISNWLPTWFLYHFNHQKVILASYAMEFASRWGAQVRANLTENDRIKTGLSKSTKSKKQFQTLLGGQMICAGMGGPITGSGADLFIIDDPIKNYKEAMSPVIRESHKDWYRSVALTRLEPNASIIILLTRWHEDDLAGWLLSNQDQDLGRTKFNLINIPALCESENDPLGRQLGEAVCPERYDEQALANLKADLGEMIFAAMFQQRPTALAGNIILREWLRFYDKRMEADDLEEVAIFCDLSYKEGPKTDFTVIEAWGRIGPDIYLLEQIRGRMGFPDQIAAIEEMASRYPNNTLKQIEEHANGAAVIEVLKQKMMSIEAVKPKTGKEARLAAVSPVFRGGNVHYPNPNFHEWVNVNISEILTFPNAQNDDTVDTACYAITYFAGMNSSIAALEALNKWF